MNGNFNILEDPDESLITTPMANIAKGIIGNKMTIKSPMDNSPNRYHLTRTSAFNKTSNSNFNKTNIVLDMVMDPKDMHFDNRIYYNMPVAEQRLTVD